ncbi:hypothetical protein ACWDOP_35830 [Nocardia sp. NPDC003693]
MVSEAAVTYSTVRRGLRASRVAIIFDGDEHWSHWARRAVYLANSIWGGAGFVFVPHHGGEVAPSVLRAVRTYDPDHVVTFARELVDFEYLIPDHLQIRNVDGQLLTGRDRLQELTSEHIDWETHTESDRQARDQVAAACSPYKHAHSNGSDTVVRQLGFPVDDFPKIRFMPGLAVTNCIQCPPNWGGLLGVAVASHAGLVDPPNPAAIEPEIDDHTMLRLTEWLMGTRPLGPQRLARLPLDGASLTDIGQAWDYTMTSLVEVSIAHTPSCRTLIVVGDTPEDFALNRLWQNTYGRSVWLPSPLCSIDQDQLPSVVAAGLARIFDHARSEPATVLVTSASLTQPKLDAVLERFRLAARGRQSGGGDPGEIGQAVLAEDLTWPQRNTTHLAIREQFDDGLTLPTEVDSSGTRTMLTPLPPPLLDDKLLAEHRSLTWHVDITWMDGPSIDGGGLTSRDLMPKTDGLPTTVVRSSRHGASYPSKRYDLVVSGIPVVNRLPRPRLRHLSLASWVDAQLAKQNLSTKLSSAGQRTAQLTRMLGGRSGLVELFAGPLLPALRRMDAKAARTADCYPHHEGVRIRAHYGVLNFSGFVALSAGSAEEEVRERLDFALRAGVIRRGLVLRCAVCTELQFQTIDKLGQSWVCERCDSNSDLGLSAWRMPLQEPVWFYDLHPVGRQLLDDNGDVPIALAAHLSSTCESVDEYMDLAEIEFVGNRRAEVEVDLVAYVEGSLIVGEAKSAAQLSRRTRAQRHAEIVKKCRAAAWIGADELIFATSTPAWTDQAESDIRSATTAFEWPSLGAPRIRLIAGLDPSETTTSTLLRL